MSDSPHICQIYVEAIEGAECLMPFVEARETHVGNYIRNPEPHRVYLVDVIRRLGQKCVLLLWRLCVSRPQKLRFEDQIETFPYTFSGGLYWEDILSVEFNFPRRRCDWFFLVLKS